MEDTLELRNPWPREGATACGTIDCRSTPPAKISVGDGPLEAGDVELLWDRSVLTGVASLYTQGIFLWRHHTQGVPSLLLKHLVFSFRHLLQAILALVHLAGKGSGERLGRSGGVVAFMVWNLLKD